MVEYLLEQGVSPFTSDGMSVLHWAAANCNAQLVNRLIALGAALESLNEYGGTVLSSTLWFADNASDAAFTARNFVAMIDKLIAAGARTDFYPELVDEIAFVRKRGV